ncbi:hypothetical protein AAZX31_20G132100 [Glycine max]
MARTQAENKKKIPYLRWHIMDKKPCAITNLKSMFINTVTPCPTDLASHKGSPIPCKRCHNCANHDHQRFGPLGLGRVLSSRVACTWLLVSLDPCCIRLHQAQLNLYVFAISTPLFFYFQNLTSETLSLSIKLSCVYCKPS